MAGKDAVLPLSYDEILGLLKPPAGEGIVTLPAIHKHVVLTGADGADTFPAWRSDTFHREWRESYEYRACLLNTVRQAFDRDSPKSPEPKPFLYKLTPEAVAKKLASRNVRAPTLTRWLQRGHTICDTVGELIWWLSSELHLWPLIVDDSGNIPDSVDVDFDHVRIRLSDWLFYFAGDLHLENAVHVKTKFQNWHGVGWSSEKSESLWTDDLEVLKQPPPLQNTLPTLLSFSRFREFFERKNANLVAGYARRGERWTWTHSNGTQLVSSKALAITDQQKLARAPWLLDDARFAQAVEIYFGDFKTDKHLPADQFADARYAICLSISIVPVPLDHASQQLGAFAFCTLLLDPRRGGGASAIDCARLTRELWRSMDMIKLPMVKQLAREEREETEIQRDRATLYHRKYVSIQPEVQKATAMIDQLSRAASRISVHVSAPVDGLFGADAGIRPIFDPTREFRLVTLSRSVRASHYAKFEDSTESTGTEVATALLAHLLSTAQGAGHDLSPDRSRDARERKSSATYTADKRAAPRRALEQEWAHLRTQAPGSQLLRAICLLVAPPSVLFLDRDEFEGSYARIFDSISGDPSAALMRAKRRLVKPLKEENSTEPVLLESLPVFVHNCMLLDEPVLAMALEKADVSGNTPEESVAWRLRRRFPNEWLLDFVSSFCAAFGRGAQWIASSKSTGFQRRESRIELQLTNPRTIEDLAAKLSDATVVADGLLFPRPSALRTGGAGDVLQPILTLLSRVPAKVSHPGYASSGKGDALELFFDFDSMTLTITRQGLRVSETPGKET